MVAGGGASVIYADTIVELGGVADLANYGEYSGGPNEIQTFEYAKTIIDLMCKHPHPDGKILIIGNEKWSPNSIGVIHKPRGKNFGFFDPHPTFAVTFT